MNLDLFIMNGYGLYVWSAFAFTLFNFLILYKVTSKQLIKEKAKFAKKFEIYIIHDISIEKVYHS